MISEPFIDYQKLFSEMAVELREMDDSGTVASYIPELRNVDPNKFGIHLTTIDNQNIDYCPRVAESEKMTGFKNAALINLMKSYGNVNNDIEIVLDFYFNLCSIEMTCKELAQKFLFLAANGVHPITQVRVVDAGKSKRINAIMQLCGFYDEAGEFSFKVGLPGKSGVGGGILAIHPGNYSIAVWGPKLNPKGNSYKGMRILEFLTTRTQSSIF